MNRDLFQDTPEQPADSHPDPRIRQLLDRTPGLWRAGSQSPPQPAGLPSGHAGLDALLPRGGWPDCGLVDIISRERGIGELQLLMPLLRRMSEQGSPMLWITPPHPVYAPALLQSGIDTRNIVLISPEISCQQALWSIEQSLQTRECALVLAWQNWLSPRVMRRLQLAANNGRTLGIVFQQRLTPHSPSTLRLQLQVPSDEAGQPGRRPLDVSLLKARGSHHSGTARVWLDG